MFIGLHYWCIFGFIILSKLLSVRSIMKNNKSFYITFTHSFFDALPYFMQMSLFDHSAFLLSLKGQKKKKSILTFCCCCHCLFVGMFCKAGLLTTISLNVYLRTCLFFLHFLKDNFTGYRFLDWCFLFLSIFKYLRPLFSCTVSEKMWTQFLYLDAVPVFVSV